MPSIKQHLTTINRTVGRPESIKYIVIHYTATGNTAAGAALANCKYFASANRGASAHYFIDDGDIIWQSVLDKDTAWSVGSKVYKHPAARNSNTLNIEVCSKGAFTAKEIANLRWLVQQKKAAYKIPASNVIRHYDVTGKACPAYYVDATRWKALHKSITEAPVAQTYRIGTGWAKNKKARDAVEQKCAQLNVKCVVDGPLYQFHADLDKIKQIEFLILSNPDLYRFHAISVPQNAYRSMGVAKGIGEDKGFDVVL